MEYLAGNPSFKIMYGWGMRLADLLSGYADADWGNTGCFFSRSTSGMAMLCNTDHIEVKNTSDYGALHVGGNSASVAGCLGEVLYLWELQMKPAPVYKDNSHNTQCIVWGHTVIWKSGQAEHIDIRKYFVHKVTQKGQMHLVKVSA